jgi:DNA repair exonuclease SbcCD nuclease subunit
MNPTKVICIGDPHFKQDNKYETDLLENEVIKNIKKYNPDFVVIMGDILHTHEKIDLYSFKRATNFLKNVKDISNWIYILIGNHDLPNTESYLTDNHVFNSFKEWNKTTCVDKIIKKEINGYSFVFTPFIKTGNFKKSLKESNLISPYSDIKMIFSHQEFKNARLTNNIISDKGDSWELSFPFIVSGHIHDYSELQKNVLYIGSPFQVINGESINKTISYFEVSDNIIHKRISLNIPNKIQLKLTPDELEKYELPPNSKVKIVVYGEHTIINRVMKTKHVRDLKDNGVIITIEDTTKLHKLENLKGKIEDIKELFSEYLYKILKEPENKHLLNIYEQLFN